MTDRRDVWGHAQEAREKGCTVDEVLFEGTEHMPCHFAKY
jgi:biotin operon repressor